MAYNAPNYRELAIPVILLILVGLVIGAKVFNFCPPVIGDILCGETGVQTLIITNEKDFQSAKDFATDVSSRVTKITPVVDPNVLQHIRAGAITSNDYKLVVLYGDNTALSYEARKEITDYVSGGGSLIIMKGAGLKGMNTDGTVSDYVFGWAIDDLASVVEFSPACPSLANCDSVSQITVTAGEMNQVQLTPVDWDHPMIERIGLNAPQSLPIENYPAFTGVVLTNDPTSKKVAWFDWHDAENKPHATPAIIAYSSGVGGGRVIYLAYNPIELNQEDLFRNIIQWAVGDT